jgi:hypothetical protein
MESLTKAQLLELLKEHLTISITTQPQDDYYRGTVGYDIKVDLSFDGTLISESTDSITLK